MKKCHRILGAGLASAGLAVAVLAAPEYKKTPDAALQRAEFMSQKRLYSQLVLEGLMLERFNSVVIYGQDMRKMSEDKQWQAYLTPAYKGFSKDFDEKVEAMVRAAKEKDLDSAMTFYTQSLQVCYNCHKYVRDEVRAGNKPAP